MHDCCRQWHHITERDLPCCSKFTLSFPVILQGEANVPSAVLAELSPWVAWLEDFMRHFLQCMRWVYPSHVICRMPAHPGRFERSTIHSHAMQ